jgi:hypothetical protein
LWSQNHTKKYAISELTPLKLYGTVMANPSRGLNRKQKTMLTFAKEASKS